jgi:methionyl-tRNA synthetase
LSEKILVAVAWPYVNGPPHLGHIAGNTLPADIFARFHRMIGNEVLMVSGSDQHGTPVALKAKEENVHPSKIAEKYHSIWSEMNNKMGFTFDLYTKTGTENHKIVVQELFLKIKENGFLTEKESKQPYSASLKMFMSDRYVLGTCKTCKNEARGDQCETCNITLDPKDLENIRSAIDGSPLTFKKTTHMYLELSKFQKKLKNWVENQNHWRLSVRNHTLGMIERGLIDRAITRDIEWGIPVPLPKYENKRIYVWFEAVTGYLSASIEWSKSEKNNSSDQNAWKTWWENPKAKHYYFQGKDNVPFHTIIWPTMLMASGNKNLPYDVAANEYLNFGGKQFSKSKKWAVWLPDFLESYDPDPLRYHLTSIMPETSDSDFTWQSYLDANNNELVATLGNFIHRVLSMTYNNFEGKVPNTKEQNPESIAILKKCKKYMDKTKKFLEKREFRNGLKSVMSLAQEGNKYIDSKAPWKQIKENKNDAALTLNTALTIISNLRIIMNPFLPFSSKKLAPFIGEDPDKKIIWEFKEIKPNTPLKKPIPLFKKLDDDIVEKEEAKLI